MRARTPSLVGMGSSFFAGPGIYRRTTKLKPIRTVEVVPFLPPELECMRELAYNLRWTWDHEIINLFRRLDKELWETSNHNPVLMLGTISQERLNEAAADDGFVLQLNRICQKHYEYMHAEQSSWFEKHQGKTAKKGTIAYFSAEFGLTEALPIYSGGLGILAGDHVKAASELGLPLVGVGIVYQEGYFRQYLNVDGWQQERYPINDFYTLPILPVKDKDGSPVMISVDFPDAKSGRESGKHKWEEFLSIYLTRISRKTTSKTKTSPTRSITAIPTCA